MSRIVLLPPPVLRWATAPLVAHGLTDVFDDGWVLPYAVAALTPFASTWLCAAAASVWHFSNDGAQLRASVALHVACASLHAVGRTELATAALYVFMLSEHLPTHFRACEPVARSGVALVGAVGSCLWRPAALTIDPFARRLVVAHVLHRATKVRSGLQKGICLTLKRRSWRAPPRCMWDN